MRFPDQWSLAVTMGIWLKCAMGRHVERKIPRDDPLVLSMRSISDHHFFCAPFEHAVREITTNSMVTYYHEFTCKSSVDGMHPSSRTEHGTPWRVPPTIAARGSVTSSYIAKLAAELLPLREANPCPIGSRTKTQLKFS